MHVCVCAWAHTKKDGSFFFFFISDFCVLVGRSLSPALAVKLKNIPKPSHPLKSFNWTKIPEVLFLFWLSRLGRHLWVVSNRSVIR